LAKKEAKKAREAERLAAAEAAERQAREAERLASVEAAEQHAMEAKVCICCYIDSDITSTHTNTVPTQRAIQRARDQREQQAIEREDSRSQQFDLDAARRDARQRSRAIASVQRQRSNGGQPHQSSHSSPQVYDDQHSHPSKPAHSQQSAPTPRTPVAYGSSPRTPYSQQSMVMPHAAHFDYSHTAQTPYSQQSEYHPHVQPGYGRSPQTPHNQQMPFQQTNFSHMNAMQGPTGGIDLNAQLNGMNWKSRKFFLSELARHTATRGQMW